MWMNKTSINSLLLLLILNSHGAMTDKNRTCQTPNDQPGECILIKKCPSIHALLEKRPIPQKDKDFLRSSHCGFTGGIPEVCCPTETIDIQNELGMTDRNVSCNTPNGILGRCIIIDDCPTLKAMYQKRPIPTEEFYFLQSSRCGIQRKTPNVCCPIENQHIAAIPDDVLPPTVGDLLPSTSECGEHRDSKIVGGTKTALNEFPWIALLIYEHSDGQQIFDCGGSLINKKYVLTAAHCVNESSSLRLKFVRLGEFNKDSDLDCIHNGFKAMCLRIAPFNISIEEKILHEEFDPKDENLKHDIALLRLEKEVEFTEYVKPICLPILEHERRRAYDGVYFTVAGWGQTEYGKSSSRKLKVSIPFVKNSKCRDVYLAANREITDNQICAGGESNKDSCVSDSGGPLMSESVKPNGDTNWYLDGIVSYGPNPCGKKNWPGIHTRVSKYMGWILRHMKP